MTSPAGTASPEIKALAARLSRMERLLAAVGGPQLANSSLEDAAVNEYDADGQVTSTWGRQIDGTHGVVALAGPKGPTPTGVTLEQIGTGVRVGWQGGYEALIVDPSLAPTEQVAALNFGHAEVHVSTDPDFTGLFFATKVGEIVSARGGTYDVAVGAGVEVYARIVVRDNTGKASDPSAVVGPVAGGKLSADQVDIDLSDLSGTTVWYDPLSTPPANPHAGDLWLAAPDNIPFRRELDNLGAGYWIEIRDSGVAGALIEAQAAATAAATKNRTFPQASDPAAALGPDDAGDIWIDTDDGHRLRSWTGTGWTDLLLGTSAFQPNSIVASTILATGSISGALLSATAIDGKTITGALIRSAAEGARIEITSADGLRGIDATGKVLTQVGTDGVLRAVNAFITGTLETAESGARIRVSQAGLGGGFTQGSVEFLDQNGNVGAQVAATSYVDGNRPNTQLSVGSSSMSDNGVKPSASFFINLAPEGGWKSYINLDAEQTYVTGTIETPAGTVPSQTARASLGVRSGWTGNIAGESPLEYWKIGGIVFIQGSVSNNGDYTPSSTIIPVLSLPVGFRPRGWVLFMAPNQRTSFVYGDVSTAGVLRFNRGPLQTAGAIHNISIFYPAA